MRKFLLALLLVAPGCLVTTVITDIRPEAGHLFVRRCDLKVGFANIPYTTACDWQLIKIRSVQPPPQD